MAEKVSFFRPISWYVAEKPHFFRPSDLRTPKFSAVFLGKLKMRSPKKRQNFGQDSET